MTWPLATKNNMLGGQTFTDASLHTAFPGNTGTSEVSGGAPAYARKAITINAPSGGIRALNASVAFDVPASTVRWVGFWNGAAFVGTAPNGGATPKNFMSIASTDLVYAAAHGWSDTQKIVFYNGTPPGGLTEGTVYFRPRRNDRHLQSRGHIWRRCHRLDDGTQLRLRGLRYHRGRLRSARHAHALIGQHRIP